MKTFVRLWRKRDLKFLDHPCSSFWMGVALCAPKPFTTNFFCQRIPSNTQSQVLVCKTSEFLQHSITHNVSDDQPKGFYILTATPLVLVLCTQITDCGYPKCVSNFFLQSCQTCSMLKVCKEYVNTKRIVPGICHICEPTKQGSQNFMAKQKVLMVILGPHSFLFQHHVGPY